MSPSEAAFFRIAQARAARLRPDLARAVLAAFQILRDSLSEAELTRLVQSGQLDRLVQEAFSDRVLERAFLPVRQQIRRATETSFRYSIADLPKAGKVDGTVAVMFDVLSPKVIDAIRSMDIKLGSTFGQETREVVRAFVENGLRDGVNPRTIARGLRETIGLAPNQEQWVRDYRTKLLHAHEGPSPDNTLRDRRYDAVVAKARKSGEVIPASKVETMVKAYSDRMKSYHSETIARTAALDAMKQGQALAWSEAIEKGVVDGDRLYKTWVGVMDERERDSHVAMEGDTVRHDEPYRNGQDFPGQGEYSCRCLSRYSVVRAA